MYIGDDTCDAFEGTPQVQALEIMQGTKDPSLRVRLPYKELADTTFIDLDLDEDDPEMFRISLCILFCDKNEQCAGFHVENETDALTLEPLGRCYFYKGKYQRVDK